MPNCRCHSTALILFIGEKTTYDRRVAPARPEVLLLEPQLRALVAAMLQRTYRDLASGPRGNGHDVSAKDYRDAQAFIESGWFSTLCEFLDLDSELARKTFTASKAS